MTEFLLGAERPEGVELDKKSELDRMLLLTESYDRIWVTTREFWQLEGGASLSLISGFEFGRGSKTKRTSARDEGIIQMTFKKPTDQRHYAEMGEKAPFLRNLEIQQVVYENKNGSNGAWLGISYFRIEDETSCLEVGSKFAPGLSSTTKSPSGEPCVVRFLQPLRVDSPCMIAGVGDHQALPFCLQIISVPKGPTKSILHECFHGKAKAGVSDAAVAWTDAGETVYTRMDSQLICLESDEPLQLLNELWEDMLSCPDKWVVYRAQPKIFDFLDRALSERDTKLIMSVLRLERHLAHRIQNRLNQKSPFRVTTLEEEACRVSLRRVFSSLSRRMARCQNILVNKPEMNCYTVAFLKPELFTKVAAFVTIICQLSLVAVLVNGVNFNFSELLAIKDTVYLAPVIACFASMLCYKQATNSLAFRRAFPEFGRHAWGYLDFSVNLVVGVLVVLLNYIVLVSCDSQLDFVLNSVAAFFIVELDDFSVFLDADGVTDLYRSHMVNFVHQDLDSIQEKLYFRWRDLQASQVEINFAKCDMVERPLPTLLERRSQPDENASDKELQEHLI